MLWIDFTVESFPDGSFCIKGDTPSEVLGRLYKPGDVFVVNSRGVLMKQDKFVEFMENGKRTGHKSIS
jgi:filamentous hemagglutinin family protein